MMIQEGKRDLTIVLDRPLYIPKKAKGLPNINAIHLGKREGVTLSRL
jgi:hypothetical protein